MRDYAECDHCGDQVPYTDLEWAGEVVNGEIVPILVCGWCVGWMGVPAEEMTA